MICALQPIIAYQHRFEKFLFVYQHSRFIRWRNGEETLFVFIDCEKELLSFRGFMRTSVLIAVLGLLSVFVLLLLLSGRIVKPMAESYEKQKRLQNENCNDEANFEKIKANVYDIFKTILSAAMKQHGDDSSKVQDFFMKKLEQISSEWAASYEKAEQNDDTRKMCIEKIKMSTAQDVKENILQIWEENK